MTPERLKRWLQGTAVLAVGVLGFWLLVALREEPVQVDPPRVASAVSVQPARAGSGAIRVQAGGTVRPSAEVPVAAEVGGVVAWVSPDFVGGGRVRQGDVLLRIDSTQYGNAVDVALADVAEERVNLLEAEAEARHAAEEWDRLAALRNRGDSAPPEGLVTRGPQLEAARAAVRRAEAHLENARLALAQTSLRAPFDGVVREATVSAGRIVAAGEPLGHLFGTDDVEVVVRLSGSDASLVDRLWEARPGVSGARIGAEVRSEYGDAVHTWDAYVDRAEAALHELTRMVTVVLRVPRPLAGAPDQPGRPPLLIGSYVTVGIEGRSFDRYVVIPSAALREGDVVWTVRQDTILEITPVEPVQAVDAEVTVVGPIADGDLVVTSELPFVADGMAVRVTPAPDETTTASPADSPGQDAPSRR